MVVLSSFVYKVLFPSRKFPLVNLKYFWKFTENKKNTVVPTHPWSVSYRGPNLDNKIL